MFDVGFSELIVIALVALIVIGPERLPRVARTAGHLLGRLQRYVGDVKADINREMQLEELKKVQQDMEQSVRTMESSVTQELGAVESALNNSILPPPSEQAATPTSDVPAAAPSSPEQPAAVADVGGAPQMDLGFESQQAASKKTA
jgi:sec-independent protein translocase protein TatB